MGTMYEVTFVVYSDEDETIGVNHILSVYAYDEEAAEDKAIEIIRGYGYEDFTIDDIIEI